MTASEWQPGIPNFACVCDVRPTRVIRLRFTGGQEHAWEPWDRRIATVDMLGASAPKAYIRWPAVKDGTVIIDRNSPVVWRAIVVPEGV